MSGRPRLGATVLVSLIALAACGCGESRIVAPAEAQGSTGILAGRVTGWPGGPVEGGGIPPGSAGAAGVEILVTHIDGRPAASARTDAQGEFRLTLPAGTYQIAVAGLRPGEFVKGLPRAATIRPGTDTRVEIRIDSGVR